MKYLIVILVFLVVGPGVFAQEKGYIKKGNELYSEQKYKEAESDYRKSVGKKKSNIEGNFNLGDALYKQKKFADAGEQFNKLAASANNNKALTAKAYHNLGNSLLENKKLEESIEAYKKALLNNPKDDETRYNLAYAQQQLKKQQQKKQNKNNKDQRKQDNKDRNKQKQDTKDQNKQNQDKQNQNKDKKDQQNEQEQQPGKLSKEEAERMLDALNNDEKQTQDKLKNKKLRGAKVNITKDW
ncbi:MAG: tetratricopeptide repeat protein [Sphingobacteriales bacterium]